MQQGVKIVHDCPAQPEATQAPPEHAWPPPQRTPQAPQLDVDPRAVSQPSPALALQSPKPVLQAMPQPDPTQRPVALGAPTQVVTVLAVPALLHRLSIVADTHEAVFGEHTVAAPHDPAEQLCPAAQAVGVYPRPSALQTCRAVGEAQLTSPGAQTHARQAPARQVVRDAQLFMA